MVKTSKDLSATVDQTSFPPMVPPKQDFKAYVHSPCPS